MLLRLHTELFAESMSSKILLQCVKVGSKLRVRFFAFIDESGTIFINVYDNTYNCQFPRDIRSEGRIYEIGGHDLSLVDSGNRTPFYRVAKTAIRTLSAQECADYGIIGNTIPATAQKGSRKARKSWYKFSLIGFASSYVCMSVYSRPRVVYRHGRGRNRARGAEDCL